MVGMQKNGRLVDLLLLVEVGKGIRRFMYSEGCGKSTKVVQQ
jgi:hypothetical protein